VVQLDPIKPKLKLPGTQRFKFQCEELPSSFAFKFNLRRYNWVSWDGGGTHRYLNCYHASVRAAFKFNGRCKTQRLKLEYHKLLTTSAFNFNLRQYSADPHFRSEVSTSYPQ